jgi:hypothetical protein
VARKAAPFYRQVPPRARHTWPAAEHIIRRAWSIENEGWFREQPVDMIKVCLLYTHNPWRRA